MPLRIRTSAYWTLTMLVSAGCLDSVGPMHAVSLIVFPSRVSLLPGDTTRIATFTNPSPQNPQDPHHFRWHTLDTAVAHVDSTGLLRAGSPGSTTAVVTWQGTSATIQVSVQQLRAIAPSPGSAQIVPRQTYRIRVRATDPPGAVIPTESLVWSSNAPQIATVDSVGNVTGHSFGVAAIHVVLGSSGPSADMPVYVTSLVISPAAPMVLEGDTLRLAVVHTDGLGDTLPPPAVSWTSFDTTVLTIDSTGLARGLAPGASVVQAFGPALGTSLDVSVIAPTIVGAGDIAECTSPGDYLTAAIIDTMAGVVFTAGDNAYPDGSDSAFASCYAPTWGRFKSRTRPALGNHEYESGSSVPYFRFFGSSAGPSPNGYYSYDIASWHIIVLNSQFQDTVGSPQEKWLKADLASHARQCTLAYWHYPLFSSGLFAVTSMRPAWRDLYAAGAEVIINGHDHHYERFAPQTPDGILDSLHGIREFIAGTGGGDLQPASTPAPNSEVKDYVTFGVLQMTLHIGKYSWRFIPIDGESFSDSGTTACH